MVKSIISYFTLVKAGNAFIDKVSNRQVYYFEDFYGDVYLKDSRWSFFSVPINRDVHPQPTGER